MRKRASRPPPIELKGREIETATDGGAAPGPRNTPAKKTMRRRRHDSTMRTRRRRPTRQKALTVPPTPETE